MQLSEIRQNSLSLLGQLANSKAAELPSGVNTTPVITATDTLTQFINEGQNELAREVWPWEDTASATVSIGTRGVVFATMTSAAGGTIFSASSATWNGVSLRRISRDMAYIYYRTIETDANAPVKNWSEWNDYGILLYPWPDNQHTLSVVGLATPPPLVADADVPSFLPSSLHKYLSYYAAGKVAEKNVENPDLVVRIPVWNTEWEQGKAALYEKALSTQPSLVKRLERAQGGSSHITFLQILFVTIWLIPVWLMP